MQAAEDVPIISRNPNANKFLFEIVNPQVAKSHQNARFPTHSSFTFVRPVPIFTLSLDALLAFWFLVAVFGESVNLSSFSVN